MRAASLRESFRFAFAGLFYILRTQRNARIHVVLALLVIVLGAWLRLDLWRWTVLTLTMGMVFTIEAVNTAIETLVDLVSPETHPLAKVAKDTAAAAVLVSAMIALLVGLLVLGPPLLVWLLGTPLIGP